MTCFNLFWRGGGVGGGGGSNWRTLSYRSLNNSKHDYLGSRALLLSVLEVRVGPRSMKNCVMGFRTVLL